MNEALAQWEAANAYAKAATVEDAMQILANAGYNSDNWVCLTTGYEVYWYDEDNRCILYNSATAEIEYPEEYIGAKTKDGTMNIMLSEHVHIYNENHVKAQQFNMSLSSSNATIKENGAALSSINSSKTTLNGVALSSATASSASNLAALSNSSDIIKAKLGNGSSLNVYATKEVVSADVNGAYASMQISSMSTTGEPVLKSDGSYQENVYYLSVVQTNGTPEQIAAAKLAAAQYVYTIFDQITTEKVDDNAVIIIAPDTELDCSLNGADWAPCKTFQGYFGTTDKDHPIIISGANLTSKTGYAQTVRFEGNNSYYFVTGFFGTVYGDTTIENVTFRNINIETPAIDYQLVNTDKKNSRNCVGIIGGITDGYENDEMGNPVFHNGDVKIKNIVVDSTCTITGRGTAAGLVGYIGSASSNAYKNATYTVNVTIDSCKVSAKVSSIDTGSQAGYADVGGITGLHCRSDHFFITIKDVKFDGTVDGYHAVAGICGDTKYQGSLTFTGTVNSEDATINGNNTAQYFVSLFNSNDAKFDTISMTGATFTVNSDLQRYSSLYGSNKAANVGYYTYNESTQKFTKVAS